LFLRRRDQTAFKQVNRGKGDLDTGKKAGAKTYLPEAKCKNQGDVLCRCYAGGWVSNPPGKAPAGFETHPAELATPIMVANRSSFNDPPTGIARSPFS